MGLLIALDALVSIGMVETGTNQLHDNKYHFVHVSLNSGKSTIVDMGPMTSTIWISILAFVMIAVLMAMKAKGAFIIGIMFGSIVYWVRHPSDLPDTIFVRASDVKFSIWFQWSEEDIYKILRLVADLVFIGYFFMSRIC